MRRHVRPPTFATRPQWSHLVSAVLGVLLIAGCGGGREPVASGPLTITSGDEQHAIAGARTVAVLANPERVTAFKVLSPFTPNLAELRKGKPSIGGEFVVVAQANVAADVARTMSAVLRDPDTYDRSQQLMCTFDPRHALRFERGADAVEVIICFKCGDLYLIPSASLGENGGIQPFGAGAGELYAAMQKIFPDQKVASGH